MREGGFVTHQEYQKHIQGEWRTVHDLWPHIRHYMISYAQPGGFTSGSVPFADATGFLVEDNPNLFWDATLNVLEVLAPTLNTYIGKGVIGAGHATGQRNVYVGYEVGHDATEAAKNVIMGYWAGYKHTSGGLNTLIGYYAGYEITESQSNTCIGAYAGQTITTGQGLNVCIGRGAGHLTTGKENVAVGVYSLTTPTTGSRNTCVGYDAEANAAAAWYRIAIGFQSQSNENNLCAIGGLSSTTSVNLAIFYNREFRFYDDGDNYVGFKAPALDGNQIWVLPATDGPANEVIGTDNAGNLIWRTHDELAGYEAGEHFTMLDEDDLASDSDTQAATQQSIKAYVDAIPGNTDEHVKIDVGAVAGYIGAASNDGVIRTGTSLSYVDGGNFITINTIQDIRTVDSPAFAGVTLGNEGLHLLDLGGDHDLIIKPGTDLGADRILTITTGDAARTITLSGNPTLDDWFDQEVKAASNVSFGTIGCGTITVADGSSINLQEDITFSGATTENIIAFPDDLAVALVFTEGTNPYLTFISTDGSEAVSIAKTLVLGTVIDAGVDTDKFLVLDAGGNVDFRTGAEVLADIGGAATFLDLTDTPGAYAGHGLETLRVNFAEDEIEFYVQTDQYVKVDAAAAPGYLGAAINDGVLRASAPLTYIDGGNFVTLGVDGTVLVDGDFASAGFMMTDGAGTYSILPGGEDVGNHNLWIGTNAGGSLVAGGLDNVLIGGNAGALLSTGDRNVIIGYDAGVTGTTLMTNCVYIGQEAGKLCTAGSNVAIGGYSGRIMAASTNNTLLGYATGYSMTGGGSNVYIGTSAGFTNITGAGNVAIGYSAGYKHIGSYGQYIGSGAGYAVTSGQYNVLIGYRTAYLMTVGGSNIFIGHDAGRGCGTSPAANVCIGMQAAYEIEGLYNVILGYMAGRQGKTQNDNTIVGYQSCYHNVTGDDSVIIGYQAAFGVAANSHANNVIIGHSAGKAITTGSQNVIVGKMAAEDLTSGSGNVVIGYMAGEGNLTVGNNQLWIANTDTATPLIYGEFDTPLLKVTGEFDVVGASKLGDGGTTNYASVAADGEITLVGTARVTKQIYLNNAAFTKGATAPTQVILGNLNAWEFDIGDDAVMTARLPPDWAAGTLITIKVCWYIDEAYAPDKEIQWRVDWSALPHDFSEAVDAPTHSGQIDSGDIDIPAVAKRMGLSTIGTIAGANLSAGDMLGFTLSRIAVTNDDPTADPAIHHLIIEYTADKLGTAT